MDFADQRYLAFKVLEDLQDVVKGQVARQATGWRLIGFGTKQDPELWI